MFSSTPLSSKGQLYVYEISTIRELGTAKLISAFVNTGIVDIYIDLDGLSCSLKCKHSVYHVINFKLCELILLVFPPPFQRICSKTMLFIY